jgi:prevent-host-death family protein
MTYDLVSGEVVITATEFKAKCLDLLDRVNSGEIRRVRITKRGKEVAVVRSPDHPAEKPWDPNSIFGGMKGTVIIPEGLDIDGPIYDPAIHGVCDPERGLWDEE